MHFMSPLPHLAHKGHIPYLLQAAKTLSVSQMSLTSLQGSARQWLSLKNG